MANIYIPIHFKVYEFFPMDFYDEVLENNSIDFLWGLMDWRVTWTSDRLRKRYGKITINDWHWGGNNQYRGYRPANCEVGAELSQHKFFKAADLIFNDVIAEDVRKDVLSDPFHEDFQHITCLEINISWFHMDFRYFDKKKYGIKLVQP